MEVPVICTNDSNRPNEIPLSKWVKKGNPYTVIFTVMVLPQRQLAFHLAEIELTANELPYEFFLASRFSIRPEDVEKLLALIKECTDTDFSVDELLKQTELQEV